MISLYTTKVEAIDEYKNLLFTLEMQDKNCCTMSITNNLLLSNDNLEKVLDAVRQAVNLLKLD
jgi:hypothetical protein